MTRVLDTTTFVVLGEGLAAGVGHFSLSEDVQSYSFPAQVAKKIGASQVEEEAGGKKRTVRRFEQPLMQPPGVGNVGFQQLPAIVPDLLQTTVLADLPHDGDDLGKAELGNLSVPGFSVADALNRRPKAPVVWTDDPKQTLVNLILGIPSFTNLKKNGGRPPTQVEYARKREPTLVLVALGYQEVLEPLVPGHIHGGERADLASFEKDYKQLLTRVSGGKDVAPTGSRSAAPWTIPK